MGIMRLMQWFLRHLSLLVALRSHWVHVIWLASLLSFTEGGSNICSGSSVTACIQPMLVYNLSSVSTIVPTHDPDTMAQICNTWQGVEECLAPIKPYCSYLDQVLYLGVSESYEYICQETLDEYIKHYECLSTPELHEEGIFCNQSYHERLSQIDPGADPDYIQDRVCQYTNDYISCIYNNVYAFCGQEAAEWQKGLDIRILWHLLHFVKCEIFGVIYGDDGSSVSITMVVAIFLSVVFFFVVILAGCLGYQRHKKRKAVEDMRRQTLREQEVPSPFVIYEQTPREGTDAYEELYTSPGGTQPPPYEEKQSAPPGYMPNSNAPVDNDYEGLHGRPISYADTAMVATNREYMGPTLTKAL